MKSIALYTLGMALGASALPCAAGEVDVVAARVRCTESRTCRFQVTLRHTDEGWEHYADRWEVLTPDGEVIATRVLRHPHVNEQPFTRTLAGVQLPPDLEALTIRAHDLVHEYGGAEHTLQLTPTTPPEASPTP